MNWGTRFATAAPGTGLIRGWWRLRRPAIARALPEALEIAAVELGRGAGLLPAVRCMAGCARPPLRALFGPLRELESGGVALQLALQALCERTASPELALLAHTVALVPHAASSPQALLLRLARRLRWRQAAAHRHGQRARRARWRTRLLALAIAGLPFTALALRPGVARAWLAAPGGRALVAGAVLCACAGACWLARASRAAPARS